MQDKELKKIFNAKKEKIDSKTKKLLAGFKNATFEQFKEWFATSEFVEGCHYCGTTNERTFQLYNKQRNGLRFDATRGGKRGKRLELDRKDPSLHYDKLDNIVWCCYWCNNAKSNFFTQDEFVPIAIAIGEAIKNIK